MSAATVEPVITLAADLNATTSQADLLAGLKVVLPAVAKRPAVPALGGVLIVADSGTASLTATDFLTWITEGITASGTGRAVVAAHALHDFVKDMAKGARVTLTVEGDRLAVTGDGVTYRLPLLPLDDYPSRPARPDCTVGTMTGDQLAELLAPLPFVASAGDRRTAITALHVRYSAGLIRSAGTDSYRLGVAEVFSPSISPAVDGMLLLPAAAAKLLPKLFPAGPVVVRHDVGRDSHVTFSAGTRTVTVLPTFGDYPNVDRIMPDDSAFTVTVEANRAGLAKAVTQVAKAGERNEPVRLELSDPSGLTLRMIGDVEAEKSIPVTVTGDGDGFRVAYNPGFLASILTALGGETVTYRAVTASKPGLFTTPDRPGFRVVIMPVRIAG